jgi:hypothetical protein
MDIIIRCTLHSTYTHENFWECFYGEVTTNCSISKAMPANRIEVEGRVCVCCGGTCRAMPAKHSPKTRTQSVSQA